MNVSTKIIAFIDESGNPDIETTKPGASKYFIVSAIVINVDTYDSLQQNVKTIRKKHFQTGEIKSSKIRNRDNHQRRIRILKDVLTLDFRFLAIAVNKSAISKNSGLQYKKSFLKFINGLLYKELFENFINIEIYAAQHGSDAFQTSFKNYIRKKTTRLIFSRRLSYTW